MPIYRVIRLANTIGIDPRKLVLTCLKEYQKPAHDILNKIGMFPCNDRELGALVILYKDIRENNSK